MIPVHLGFKQAAAKKMGRVVQWKEALVCCLVAESCFRLFVFGMDSVGDDVMEIIIII